MMNQNLEIQNNPARVSIHFFNESKRLWANVCYTYVQYDRRGGIEWTRPTPPISDVKAQRRSGWALSFLGFFSFSYSQQDPNVKEKTPRWKCARKCLMEMKPEQVRLRRQHRKSTRVSPLSKIPLSFFSSGRGTSSLR